MPPPQHRIKSRKSNSYILSKFQTSILFMASWKKTITTPFRKACTFFNQQPRDKKSSHQEHEKRVMDLHGEVMACGYEDVQVMWSILDKSRSTPCNMAS